ncbi:MAG: rod shape-determining protein MreC [Anaerolineae bacterium]|nr:rod shape-determining protein MreC [Anaerolineae bacterium]
MNSKSGPWQSIAIALVVIGILALALGGYMNSIGQAVLSPFVNAQAWITVRYYAYRDLIASPEEIADLYRRNAQLEAEISNLQTEIIALRQQVVEVEMLTTLLDFARARPQNDYQAAAVIGRDPRPFLQYVIINRGSDDGIKRGMPVVSAEGLIGRVAAVTAGAARVQLITDPSSKVNVLILPAEVDAVVQGSITSDIFLDLIPQDAPINPGDLVLTSGLGGNYPPDILVGQISSVRKEATALFQQASLQPVVDFNRLQIVLIIVNFTPLDISPLLPEGVQGRP